MKKKILALVLATVIVVSAALGGTLAYLTDGQGSVNVATTGNVKIKQYEMQRDDNGELVDFRQGMPLYPAYYAETWNVDTKDTNGYWTGIEGAMDKVVYVENTGRSDAYIRTWIALECPTEDMKLDTDILVNKNDDRIEWVVLDKTVEIDKQNYIILCATYMDALEAGETSAVSLRQVALSGKVDDEDLNSDENNTYEVLAFTQAVQTVNLPDYKTALVAAFGEVIEKNIPWDVDKYEVKVTAVTSAEELMNALSEDGMEVYLANDFAVENTIVIPDNVTVTLNLNDYVLDGRIVLNSSSELTVVNGTIENKNPSESAIQNNGGKLTLDDVDIKSDRHGVRVEGGYVVINGGTYNVTTNYLNISRAAVKPMTQHALNVSDGAVVIINGGEFIGPKDTGADSGSAVNVQANSEVTINGGIFRGGLNDTLSSAGTLTVKGGTFDQNPSAYVPSGCIVSENNDGSWKVEKLVPKTVTWDGKTVDTSWYNETDETFTLDSAEDFVGFAQLVSEDANNFKEKTINLVVSIDLDGAKTMGNSFAPIGSTGERDDRNRVIVEPFKGTFDGNGCTISNLYQSGWDFGYEWGQYGSLGLFGELESATVKNVVLEGFDCAVEGGDISFIAGSATGNCTFENIEIKSGSIGTYNNGIGGIIGWSGAGTYNFKDITLGEDVVIGGLWGSFDSSIGGIVGQAEPGATYNFENVNVACRIDAYNDCTASYDYYNYRMCGMLIGRLEETTKIDGTNYPDTSKYNITCKNVTVTYGEWADYHYCEPTPGLNGGRGMRVEAGYAYDGLPEDFDHTKCTTNHMTCIPFDQIFGGDQLGVKGLKTYDGVKVIYNNDGE